MRFLVGLLVLIILGSCASLGKGVFIKRKYNKGFHIDLASRKRADPKDKIQTLEKTFSPDEKEIVVVGKQKSEPKQKDIQEEKEVAQPVSNSEVSFATGLNDHHKVRLGIKENLVKKVSASTAQRNAYSDFKFGLILILFIVLTVIYTISILANYPGFPFGLAVVVAMIGSLLTLLTGQVLL